MSTLFPDVKPFPEPNPRAVMGDNRPPLEESIVTDFDDALEASGLTKRINDLVEKGADPADCLTAEKAGQYGDYKKLVLAADKQIDEEREKLNRPLLTAQRNLKGRADGHKTKLATALKRVLDKVDAFMEAERKKAKEEEERQERIRQAAIKAAEEEAQRQRDEAAAARAAEADAVGEAAPPEPESAPTPVFEMPAAKVEQPVFRGDYGSRIGSRTEWRFRIPSVRKLPNDVLNHEKVIAAINQVVGQRVRGGARKITGVEIWDEQVTSIR